MTNCDYQQGDDGLYRCAACGDVRPMVVRRNCKSPPKLLGDRLKAFFAAIGIPACGGCDKRAEMLNEAHRTVKRFLG